MPDAPALPVIRQATNAPTMPTRMYIIKRKSPHARCNELPTHQRKYSVSSN